MPAGVAAEVDATIVGADGATVSTVTDSAVDAPLVPPEFVAVAVSEWPPSASARRGEAPGAARIRRCRTDLRRAIEHLHGAVGGRRPRQGQRVVVGDTVAGHPAVVGERGDRRGSGGRRRRRRDRHRRRLTTPRRYCRRYPSPWP